MRAFAESTLVPLELDTHVPVCAGCGGRAYSRVERTDDNEVRVISDKRHTVLDCLRTFRRRIEKLEAEQE